MSSFRRSPSNRPTRLLALRGVFSGMVTGSTGGKDFNRWRRVLPPRSGLGSEASLSGSTCCSPAGTAATTAIASVCSVNTAATAFSRWHLRQSMASHLEHDHIQLCRPRDCLHARHLVGFCSCTFLSSPASQAHLALGKDSVMVSSTFSSTFWAAGGVGCCIVSEPMVCKQSMQICALQCPHHKCSEVAWWPCAEAAAFASQKPHWPVLTGLVNPEQARHLAVRGGPG